MLKLPSWRTLVVAAVCLFGVLALVPNFLPESVRQAMPSWLPNRAITLGLDLQGGSYLLLEVDVAPVFKERLESMVGDVRGGLRAGADRLSRAGRAGRRGDAHADRPGAARPGAGRDRQAQSDDRRRCQGGSATSTSATRRGGSCCGSPRPSSSSFARSAINQSLEVVRRRIDELGTREASIQRQGADRILVQVPGEKNPENIKRLLGRTARLTFHMVDLERQRRRRRCRAVCRRAPCCCESAERDGGSSSHYVVKRQVELSGENLIDAQPTFQDNQPVVSFRLDNAGARKFGKITQENVGKPFAIVLDDKVISAPQHPRADPRRLAASSRAASRSRSANELVGAAARRRPAGAARR